MEVCKVGVMGLLVAVSASACGVLGAEQRTDVIEDKGQRLTVTLADDDEGSFYLEYEDRHRRDHVIVDLDEESVPEVSDLLASMDPAFLFHVRREVGSRDVPADRAAAAFLHAELALVGVAVPSELEGGAGPIPRLWQWVGYTGCFYGCMARGDSKWEDRAYECGEMCRDEWP